MDLYSRRYSLTVGTTKITGAQGLGLRIVFTVKKNLSKDPNTAELKIYNMSGATRQQLQGKGIPVILSAGYGNEESVIFSGDSRIITHSREGASWVTKIQSGDGERAYATSRFHRSYAANTPVSQVMREIAGSISLNPGNLSAALSEAPRGGLSTFARGYVASGNALDLLAGLAKSIGFSMSVQGGALQFLRNGAAPGSAVLLSPDTGLIGSPEFSTPDQKGAAPKLVAKSLLQPTILCGGQAEIRAEQVKGRFRVEAVEHSGDFHGKQWYTQIEAKAL